MPSPCSTGYEARSDASLDRDADDVEAGAAATPGGASRPAREIVRGNPCHLLNREVAGNPMLEADMARARTVVSGLENSARHARRYVECRGPVGVLVDLATDPACFRGGRAARCGV